MSVENTTTLTIPGGEHRNADERPQAQHHRAARRLLEQQSNAALYQRKQQQLSQDRQSRPEKSDAFTCCDRRAVVNENSKNILHFPTLWWLEKRSKNAY